MIDRGPSSLSMGIAEVRRQDGFIWSIGQPGESGIYISNRDKYTLILATAAVAAGVTRIKVYFKCNTQRRSVIQNVFFK